MVGAVRFELTTSCTPSKRAYQATLRPDSPLLNADRSKHTPAKVPGSSANSSQWSFTGRHGRSLQRRQVAVRDSHWLKSDGTGLLRDSFPLTLSLSPRRGDFASRAGQIQRPQKVRTPSKATPSPSRERVGVRGQAHAKQIPVAGKTRKRRRVAARQRLRVSPGRPSMLPPARAGARPRHHRALDGRNSESDSPR
jgi:hypothetical protein